MKTNRFNNFNLVFGSVDISTLFSSICACIAEAEHTETKEEDVAVA